MCASLYYDRDRGSGEFTITDLFGSSLLQVRYQLPTPDTINFAAPDGLPAGDSVTIRHNLKDLRFYKPT
jgi:hypothetical protein